MDYSPSGYELHRTMRVIKMRGSDHDTHPYRLAIASGGLSVEKITQADFARQTKQAQLAP
jgi:KaiC/GvpD/RAD55 family RecA-like ATPase